MVPKIAPRLNSSNTTSHVSESWQEGHPLSCTETGLRRFSGVYMKYIILIPVLIFTMFAQAEGVPVLSDLESLVWMNRVIVVNETNNENKDVQLLKSYVAEIDDRDIIWFVISGDHAATNHPGQLSHDFVSNTRNKLEPVQGKVTLIGKDGGIKFQSDSLDLEVIFSEIDAMPMRQFEMNDK